MTFISWNPSKRDYVVNLYYTFLLLGTRGRYHGAKLLAAAPGQAAAGHRVILLHLRGLEAEAQPALVRVEIRLHRHRHAEGVLEKPFGGDLAHVRT